MKYRYQVASDVQRDGLCVELVDEDHRVVAEVFRCDRDNTITFSAYVRDLPFVQVERLIAMSRGQLTPFENGEPLPTAL